MIHVKRFEVVRPKDKIMIVLEQHIYSNGEKEERDRLVNSCKEAFPDNEVVIIYEEPERPTK
jgi:hypothetical protein